MAKKPKKHKEKMPKVTKISQEQMDNFLAAIMDSNISTEYAEFAKMLIHPKNRSCNDPSPFKNDRCCPQ